MRHKVLAVGIFLGLLTVSACSNGPAVPTTPTPTLAPDRGRVVGILQIREGNSSRPVSNVNLYLGGTIRDNTGKELMIGFERVSSPRAVTEANGYFAFHNIPTGNYGLILDMVFDSFLLAKPDADEAVLVSVSGGKQVDLGTLFYDSLPLVPTPHPIPIRNKTNCARVEMPRLPRDTRYP